MVSASGMLANTIQIYSPTSAFQVGRGLRETTCFYERNRYKMSQNLKQLTPVDLSEIWETEPQHFTPWLAQEENLTLLGNTLGIELELEAQEINVGDFRADILCKNTEDDSWVLIENQLEATDHKHVGQILTYAAGLDAFTVIWIAKTFRREHCAMLDWQNRITDERYRFFGVEMKVWQIEDSARATQFDVVSSPNDWNRDVSRDTQRAANKEVSDRRQWRIRYWTGLREFIVDNGSSVNCPTPTGSNLRLSIGRTNFSVYACLASSKREIDIRLYMAGDFAKAHYHLLKEQQEEIHTEFGETLEWHELPENERSRISLSKTDTDPLDENDWRHQYKWFTAKLERFDEVFRPRIRGLDPADWIPEDDDE